MDLLTIELSLKGASFEYQAMDELKKVVKLLDAVGKESPGVTDKDYKLAVAELREKLKPAP